MRNNHIYDDFGKESELQRKRIDIERAEKWEQVRDNTPFLSGFKLQWKVKIAPPINGAVARFIVEYNNVTVSVYLDWYSRLGCMNIPYYEIYDYRHSPLRFPLEESKEMMNTINQMLTNCYVDRKEKLEELIKTVDLSKLDKIMYYDELSGQYNTAYDEMVKVLTKCQEVME